ncbi:MAG: DUF3859 domain-containing protein [Spirochaetales bacterium]|nr:DUF3859 domain-containing protein [Spirochaetales bacterium]
MPEKADLILSVTVTHPPIIMPPDNKVYTRQSWITKNRRGDFNYDGYGFDIEEELVAGDWKFEIGIKGRTLIEMTFTVVK